MMHSNLPKTFYRLQRTENSHLFSKKNENQMAVHYNCVFNLLYLTKQKSTVITE